jgi:hypothetical protein
VRLRSRTRVVLAWALWLLTFGRCAAGLLVTLAVYRPLSVGVLVEGALYAFFFVLGFATVGLVLALRRPANPTGWLYGAAGLAWAYTLPMSPWIDQLVREHRHLPLVATLAAVAAFSPLRRRVQGLVDRRFNRRRYGAARTLEGLATRRRDQVDLDALHGELLGRGRPDDAADPGLPVAPHAPWQSVEEGSGCRGHRLCSGSAPSRARPPSRCSRHRPAEVKGTSSSRDAFLGAQVECPLAGRRERGSRRRRVWRSTT